MCAAGVAEAPAAGLADPRSGFAGIARLAEEALQEIVRRLAPKKSDSSWVRSRISVLMLTTIGDCAFATFRNVWASSAPVTGALFMAGTARV